MRRSCSPSRATAQYHIHSPSRLVSTPKREGGACSLSDSTTLKMATELPRPPSQLELFVIQRVSAEIQPMLDLWKESVTTQLTQIYDVQEGWIAGFKQDLAELRAETLQRASREDALKSCYERLADDGGVGPRLVKKINEQAEAVSVTLAKLQAAVAESRRAVERTERATNADKRALLKATAEETSEAIRTAARGVEAAEKRANALEVQVNKLSVRAEVAEAALEARGEELEQLRVALLDYKATEEMLEEARGRLVEDAQSISLLHVIVVQQSVACGVLVNEMAELEATTVGALSFATEESVRALTEAQSRSEGMAIRLDSWMVRADELLGSVAQPLVAQLHQVQSYVHPHRILAKLGEAQ